MNIGNIKLSIIVIGYNVENFIDKLLIQLKRQNTNHIEVLFVDDGSTDNTKNIVLDAIKKIKNFKYIYQHNNGANAARINGYLNASGEYITFIDGDDLIEQDYITVILNSVDDSDIVMFNYNYLYKNNEKKNNEHYILKKYDKYDFLESIMCSKIPHYLWNKVYKKDFLKKIKFEDIPKITMGDDLIACTIMGLNCPKVKVIPNSIYNYFVNINSVSRKNNEKFLEMIKVLDCMEEKFAQFNLNEKYSKEIEFQYFRTFYFYVVKNSSPKSYIQKRIYDKYKNKKIRIKRNKNIYVWLKNHKKSEQFLTNLYLINYNLGYISSRIFLFIRMIVRNIK